jgi:hypothetical protein
MILDDHDSGLFPENKTTQQIEACVKRQRNINGGPYNDAGMKGETVYMPEAFGIKSGKSPNFGRIKTRQ